MDSLSLVVIPPDPSAAICPIYRLLQLNSSPQVCGAICGRLIQKDQPRATERATIHHQSKIEETQLKFTIKSYGLARRVRNSGLFKTHQIPNRTGDQR
jgi:hypothetical protein